MASDRRRQQQQQQQQQQKKKKKKQTTATTTTTAAKQTSLSKTKSIKSSAAFKSGTGSSGGGRNQSSKSGSSGSMSGGSGTENGRESFSLLSATSPSSTTARAMVSSSNMSGSGGSSTTATSSSTNTSSAINTRPMANELTKVTILGAGGGIGQPLAMLLMLHNELVQHVAMHDLIDSIHGIGLDVSHIDRRCKITTHLGPDALAEAVRGAKVVVIPAGLAQKPGMSRDDLFASNAKILFNIVKVCAQVAPNAMLAIITNPVNSLVPIACEVYNHYLCADGRGTGAGAAAAAGASKSLPHDAQQQQKSENIDHNNAHDVKGTSKSSTSNSSVSAANEQQQKQQQQQHNTLASCPKSNRSDGGGGTNKPKFQDCFRRIFGVTTLDVVRASTLTAKSTFFKSEPNGMFKDPNIVKVPVVGGHAGKTIMPLLSQATPKLDSKRLIEEKATTMTLVDSIQQAGIEVLNAKKGRGSATIAMAYAACRFTLALLRAIMGEQNIVECAYVHQPSPVFKDLDYFATPLLLGKEGFVKSLGIPGCHSNSTSSNCESKNNETAILPYEQQMLEEGARELRSSIARGEDFARESLSSEK